MDYRMYKAMNDEAKVKGSMDKMKDEAKENGSSKAKAKKDKKDKK